MILKCNKTIVLDGIELFTEGKEYHTNWERLHNETTTQDNQGEMRKLNSGWFKNFEIISKL